VRGLLAGFPGPAHGRGDPAQVGADFRTPAPAGNAASESLLLAISPISPAAEDAQPPEDRALHCVNCGECNTVCPIFNDAKIRLPQMLTHIGEAMRAGAAIPTTGTTLLDLCMRCGNCEQVCQAGIPHLPIYDRMQAASNRARPYDRARHQAVVAAVRGSTSYVRDFLGVRPGGYIKRTPVALPGVPRFLVLRSENDAGPAATCIHCGACVPVCPTGANREFEGADPRWIQTVQEKCIGCGSCVEVCPNNHSNHGRTLRVMEAPTPAWFNALERFELTEKR
jgi:ferredoxin